MLLVVERWPSNRLAKEGHMANFGAIGNNYSDAAKDLKRIWGDARKKLLSGEALVILLDELPVLIARLDNDNDRREKREAYLAIANLLKKKTGEPLLYCVDVVHTLAAESDADILEAGAPAPVALKDRARQLLVKAAVHYEGGANHVYRREIEIYSVDLGKAIRSVVREERAWEQLPSDVRAERLRDGSLSVTFNIFPRN
jgi:hypothetical protein